MKDKPTVGYGDEKTVTDASGTVLTQEVLESAMKKMAKPAWAYDNKQPEQFMPRSQWMKDE